MLATYSVRRFWKVFRPPLELCRYTTIKHVADSSNPKNNKRFVISAVCILGIVLQISEYKSCQFHCLSCNRVWFVDQCCFDPSDQSQTWPQQGN